MNGRIGKLMVFGLVVLLGLVVVSCTGAPASVTGEGSQAAQPTPGISAADPVEKAAAEKTPAVQAAVVVDEPVPQAKSGGVSALIPVTGGPLRLECRANTLELPGGNRVVVRGLCGDYWAAVVQETKESLPPAVSLYTFVDGITLQVLQGEDPSHLTPLAEMPPGALISYHFLVLPQMAQHHLVALQFNAGAWQETGSARAGVFMEIPANQPGTFVMAAP